MSQVHLASDIEARLEAARRRSVAELRNFHERWSSAGTMPGEEGAASSPGNGGGTAPTDQVSERFRCHLISLGCQSIHLIKTVPALRAVQNAGYVHYWR